jgi:trans-2-enoyl-CoA reductase
MTALAMLTEFAPLEEGAWVIQNAANSGVGRAVIDIAKEMGVNTINIVRRDELVEEILEAGGTIVVTHEQLKNKVLKEKAAELHIKLGLNGVGGESAQLLARHLCDEGIMVTYGAMSREPVIIDNRLLIFKNIIATGFWRSKWLERADKDKVDTLYNRLFDFAENGAFHIDVEAIYPFEEASEALQHAQKDKRKGKIFLTPHG